MAKIPKLVVVRAGTEATLSMVLIPTPQDQDGRLMELLTHPTLQEPPLALLTATQRRETDKQLRGVREK